MSGKLSKFNRQKSILPIRIAGQSLNHFKEGFKKGGGMTDASKGGWKPRRQTARRNTGRALLVDSGVLRRDMKRITATWSRIEVGTSARTKDYAGVHNRGLRSGRGRGFTMPKREFIGKSKDLERKNIQMIRTTIKNILNG